MEILLESINVQAKAFTLSKKGCILSMMYSPFWEMFQKEYLYNQLSTLNSTFGCRQHLACLYIVKPKEELRNDLK